MKARSLSVFSVFYFALLFVFATNTTAQQPQSTPSNKDDVVHVNTNLIQTDVMVFDKNGKFVPGLMREQFELKIDGKRRDISFFELVKTGKIDEETKLAAARGQAADNKPDTQPQTFLLDRGRIVYLFVDDLHLSAESTLRMKKMLTRFVEREIGQNDSAAIVTTSGQLGFLQQLTDNKDVLFKAINNLKFIQAEIKDNDYPPMNEFQAMLIDRGDTDVLEVFISETMRQNPGLMRPQASQIVLGRARNLLQHNASFVNLTLQSLGNLVRDSAQLPGRKLIMFITDGFQIQNSFGDATQQITQITSQAAKSNSVIYSLEARGLVSGFENSAGTITIADPTGRLARSSGGELNSTQDGLYALARDTGGRAILNTNDSEPLVKKALEETSAYYLLAWASDDDLIRGEKFRKVEVNVIGRPDLIVKSRKGFITNEKPQKTDSSAQNKQKPVKDPITKELVSAIKSIAPLETLPTSVSAFYYNSQQYGLLVSAVIEIPKDALNFDLSEYKSPEIDATGKDSSSSTVSETVKNKPKAVVDVIGIVINEKGKTIANFQDRWTITSLKALNEQTQRGVVNSFVAKVTPGLYQIRVAIREAGSGKLGNASTWIDVPDLSLKKLTLGNLLIAERKASELQKTADQKTTASQQETATNISKRFSNSSYLRFIATIYNATLSDAMPDIVTQVQIFRDDQPVTTTPLTKIKAEGIKDFSQIPYAAEISLHGMPAGYYVLKMTVIDRIAKTSSTQKTSFIIE